jgi:hypothetical protein
MTTSLKLTPHASRRMEQGSFMWIKLTNMQPAACAAAVATHACDHDQTHAACTPPPTSHPFLCPL